MYQAMTFRQKIFVKHHSMLKGLDRANEEGLLETPFKKVV